MDATNVLVCMKKCQNSGFHELFSFSQDILVEPCKCYNWPASIHITDIDNAVPVYAIRKYTYCTIITVQVLLFEANSSSATPKYFP